VGLYRAANFELREVLASTIISALQSQPVRDFEHVRFAEETSKDVSPWTFAQSSGKAGFSAMLCDFVSAWCVLHWQAHSSLKTNII
jgi:hypothetical protein